jgi:ribonuclease R
MMPYHLKLENGNYEIGIHIADVSYYLEEGTILDDEVSRAATLFI